MPPTFDSNFRLIWIHDESGPSGIPAGFSRDNSGDGRALQGAVSGGVFGGGSGHYHTIPEHEHTSDTHFHWVNSDSGGPATGVNQYDNAGGGILAPNQIHTHYSDDIAPASIDYSTSDPGGTTAISGLFPQHITAIVIKPDSETSSIPSGIVAFTDRETPPDGFSIASGVNGYPSLSGLFVVGAASGQDGGTVNAASGGHAHETSGLHGHDADDHNHPITDCGLAGSFNTSPGVSIPGRAQPVHHTLASAVASTSGAASSTITTDASASGLEPAYTKLLGVQTTGTSDVPSGLIFGYVGSSGSLDTEWWEICNGSGTTIDLTSTQIKITTDYSEIGDTDSSSDYHTHESSHDHETSGSHIHIIIGQFFWNDAFPANTTSPNKQSVIGAKGSAHIHNWTCEPASGGSINDANLTTSSGDHRGPWYSMLWVRSKGSVSETTSGNVSLYTNGHGLASGSCVMLVHGHDSYPGNALYHISDSMGNANLNRYSVGSDVDETLYDIGNTNPRKLDVDTTNGDVYWQELGSDKIKVYRQRDGDTYDVLASGSPWGLRIDETNGKIYWVDGDSASFVASDLDGENSQALFSRSNVTSYFDIDVDNGKIYWSENYNIPSNSGAIYRANFDGSDLELLRVEEDQYYRGVALDVDDDALYYSETQTYKAIFKSHLDGSNVTTVAEDLPQYIGEIVIDQNQHQLFWSTPDGLDKGQIGSLNLVTDELVILVDDDPNSEPTVALVNNDPNLSSISLFIGGVDEANDEVALFVEGVQPISGDVDLFVRGGGIPCSGNMTLYIQGHKKLPGDSIYHIYDDNDPTGSRFVALYDVNGQSDTTLFDISNTYPRHLGLDYSNGNVFWSESSHGEINRFEASTQAIRNIITSGNPGPLYIDNDYLYWVDETALWFMRANIDGSDPIVILDRSGPATITGFDIDSINDKLYWIENSIQFGRAEVWRSNLDGSSPYLLWAEWSRYYNDICIDPDNGHIYYLTTNRKDIRRRSLGGSNETVIATNLPENTEKIDINSIRQWIYFARTDSSPDSDIGYVKQPIDTTEIFATYPSGQTPDIKVATDDHRLTSRDLFVRGLGTSSGTTPLYVGGYQENTGDLPLYTAGRQSGTDNIPLFIHGYESASGSADLFIGGHVASSGDIPLFIKGEATASGSIDLFVGGYTIASGDISLFIGGHEETSGNISLFIRGHEPASGSVDLFIGGYSLASGDIPLYIGGHNLASGNIPLFIGGTGVGQTTSGSIDLFIQGHDTTSGNADLFIGGYTTASGDIPLYVGGYSPSSGDITLFIGGYAVASGDIPLFINGYSVASGNIDLFICGHQLASGDIPLYIGGHTGSSGDIPLFIGGYTSASGETTLFIGGDESASGSIDLYIAGRQSGTDNIPLFIHGDEPASGSVDLFIGGYGLASGDISLYVGGHNLASGNIPLFIGGTGVGQTTSGSIDLFLQGYETTSGSVDLFIGGYDTTSGDTTLYIHGHSSVSGDIPLFIGGYVNASGDIPLYINGYSTTSGSTTLFIGGTAAITEASGNIPLFIGGHTGASGDTTLFIGGYTLSSGNIPLYINGYSSTSGDIPLYINGHTIASGDIPLFIEGHSTTSGSMDLFVGGYQLASGDIPLYIGGHIGASGDIPLFIGGYDVPSGDITLFIHGYLGTSGDTTLFIGGHETTSGNIPLVMTGSGIIPHSGEITLVINGYEPVEPIACPILDPTAAIQIPSSIIDIYQGRVDALLNQAGKNVTLQFEPAITDCPNCQYDPVRKRSSGHYVPGGPVSFEDGRRCPYCKGRGVLEEVSELCIKCLITWNPTDVAKFGISVQKSEEIVKLKTLIDNAPDLQRARIAIIDRQVINLVKYRATLVKGPYPIGLREDKYCISFWRTI